MANTIIRDATIDDIPAIVAMGRAFHGEAACSDIVAWDDESAAITARNLIEGDDGILIVATIEGESVGMAGGLVHPLYFNHHHRTGQELFWFCPPEHRVGIGMLMLDRLEGAALRLGAQSWSMIALDTVRPQAIGALYRRRGYRASEHSYIKRLVA